jgi:hypothetical protein
MLLVDFHHACTLSASNEFQKTRKLFGLSVSGKKVPRGAKRREGKARNRRVPPFAYCRSSHFENESYRIGILRILALSATVMLRSTDGLLRLDA